MAPAQLCPPADRPQAQPLQPCHTADFSTLEDGSTFQADFSNSGREGDGFASLLGRLQDAHERELHEGLVRLQAENAALRSVIEAQAPSRNLSHVSSLNDEPSSLLGKSPERPSQRGTPGDVRNGSKLSAGRSRKGWDSDKVRYDAQHFRVTVLAAAGLRHADWTIMGSRAPNAYCTVEVIGKPEARFQTDVLEKNTDPAWNYSGVLPNIEKTDKVLVKVFDKPARDDPAAKEFVLGQATVAAMDLYRISGDKEDRDLTLEKTGVGVVSTLRIRAEILEYNDTDSNSGLGTKSAFPNTEDTAGAIIFDLRQVWHKAPKKEASLHGRTVNLGSHATEDPASVVEEPPQETSSGILKKLICAPGNKYRIAWDIFGGLLILYDSVAIPIQVFPIPPNLFFTLMDYITLLFWSVNIPASLFVGFFHHGMVEMRFSMIVLNYFRTWFLIDCAVVVPDWYFSLSANAGGAKNTVKMLRIVRLARTIRLIRLLKLKSILAEINDLFNSEFASIVAQITKMIMMLLFINHFIACTWFFIADLQVESGGPTWLTEHDFVGRSWNYQYLTSLHWSITQFTPASVHVQPQNMWERAFAITVVVFALVGFSYLVGNITNSISQLRSMNEDHWKQFWTLRRYLKQNSVGGTLKVRIERYLEHAWQRQRTSVSEPTLLSLLSEQLRNELQCARAVPHLEFHPLFNYLKENSDVTTQRLAVRAINRRNLARHDWLFFPGETATHVYFLITGKLKYVKASMSPQDKPSFRTIDGENEKDWISEPALWTTSWIHLGTLQADTESELLHVGAGEFCDIVSLTPAVHLNVRNYGRSFVTWLNSLNPDDLTDVMSEKHAPRLRTFIAGPEHLTPRWSQTYSEDALSALAKEELREVLEVGEALGGSALGGSERRSRTSDQEAPVGESPSYNLSTEGQFTAAHSSGGLPTITVLAPTEDGLLI